jgi:hypothetical protein
VNTPLHRHLELSRRCCWPTRIRTIRRRDAREDRAADVPRGAQSSMAS